MQLKDKVILITGSSTGIGKATAELCLAEGAKVMIHGLDELETQTTAEMLKQPYLANDLSKADSAQNLVNTTIDHFGRIDGLVNNAGTVERSNLDTTDAAKFDKIIGINLRAPMLLIKAAMPHFQKQKGANVVNIGSINAYCGAHNLLPYSISKGGLTTLTRNLANVYAKDNIRINQLNPGWILSDNEIALQISEGRADDWYKHVSADFAPTGRLLEPHEVAKHILFWLSDASAPVSGNVYEVEQYPLIGRRAPDFGQ